MMQATHKPSDAVEYAWAPTTKNCIWAVNEGFDRDAHALVDRQRRRQRRHRGGEEADRSNKSSDETFANEAVAAAGGPVTIGACKE